jgi:predicted DNA binding CopG/RHH family protein
MNNSIQYTDEPLGEVQIISDFLPSPDELVLRQQQTTVTISLSNETVEFFKKAAREHNAPYQKLIRQLLDDYVAQQKRRAAGE